MSQQDLQVLIDAAQGLSASADPGDRACGDVLKAVAPHLISLRDDRNLKAGRGCVDGAATIIAAILGLSSPEAVPRIRDYFDRKVEDSLSEAFAILGKQRQQRRDQPLI